VTIRHLTDGERDLVRSMFGKAIALDAVEIRRRRWFPFQPREVAMAPSGHIHFHPKGTAYRDDFSRESTPMQAFFLHEMTHVWQRQRGIFLPLRRHPFCRYAYVLHPGRAFTRYGLEQQAEIVRHAFLLRRGATVAGAPPLAQYESVLPFGTGRSDSGSPALQAPTHRVKPKP
jgi:hypothetical protein